MDDQEDVLRDAKTEKNDTDKDDPAEPLAFTQYHAQNSARFEADSLEQVMERIDGWY